jgi:hypothetical protein
MLNSRNQSTHWTKIVNVWLGFIALMVVVSNLPHMPLPMLSWVNISLYFLAFLLTIFIIKFDKYNRDEFVPFSIMFLGYCLLLPYVLIGDQYLIHNNALGWYIYKYITLANSFLFAFSIVYYAAKHAINPHKPWILLSTTALFISITFIFFFGSMILDSGAIFATQAYYKKAVTFFLLPPTAIIAYGFLYPKFRPKHGQYYHSLMIIFALLSLREVFSHFSSLKNLFLFNVDQVFLTTTLLFLNYLLAKKLRFNSSTTGQIYSDIVNNQLQIPNLRLVGRDKNQFSKYMVFINYLYSHKYIIIPSLLSLLLILNFINIPMTVSLNLIAFTIVAFIGIFLFMISYNSKIKNGGFMISSKAKK